MHCAMTRPNNLSLEVLYVYICLIYFLCISWTFIYFFATVWQKKIKINKCPNNKMEI